MDLKQFITETVTSVIDATRDLQEKYQSSTDGVVINPPFSTSHENFYQEQNHSYTYRRIEVIDFDVAISTSEGANSGGKASLKIWSAELGADGKKSAASEEVSRVKFAIPIALSRSLVEFQNRSEEMTAPNTTAAVSDYDPFST